MTRRRCAVYTRKSTEEGLDQAFNSLDAQREACAAFILSQAHEGWEQVREQYDDGGWSGGNMARPALQQLLGDVTAGKVNVVVVYKVDRLTRSLADFARIVETLDKAGASFVSVTQSFNTTNSMGRLTLNVLLSFAQFEREVTSERIRDKMAASKRKGMWMGGPVPLGYQLANRKLEILEAEAGTVRHIFRRYLELRSIPALADELADAGICTKRRTYKTGRAVGGIPFRPGTLGYLLKNPLFMGKVRQAKELFEGEHAAIIEPAIWEQVQSTIASNRNERRLGVRTEKPSLLTGLITDPDGRPMTPTHSLRPHRCHHYYATRLPVGAAKGAAWRVRSEDIDRIVLSYVQRALKARQSLVGTKEQADKSIPLSARSLLEQRHELLELGLQVRLGIESLDVILGREEPRSIEIPARVVRKGRALKLVLPFDEREPTLPNASLLKLVVCAFVALQALLTGQEEPLTSGYTDRYVYKLLRLSWLAPDILQAIVEGRQPIELTGRRLLRAAEVPLNWESQRQMFGFH